MKHVFLLNPVAGNKSYQTGLIERIKNASAELQVEHEIHVTAGVGDAKTYVGEYPPDIDARFYAIGGDGTLNEVFNGIVQRQGKAELAVLPCGTGDDFVRVFPAKEPFLDLKKQLSATAVPIDAIKTDHINGINMINIGVDAQTAADVHRFSRFLPGSMAYIVSLINRVMRKMGTEMTVTVDDQPPLKGRFILASIANGVACGGGFYAAPRAKIDDGLLEITVVNPLSRFQFAAMVKGYKNGTHLDNPAYAPFIHYYQGKKVTIQTEKPTEICVDGEMIKSDHIIAEIQPNSVYMVIPK